MATKMSRKSNSNSSVSPARRGNVWPDKETQLSLSPKALPTILSDTSPQEEVRDEVRRRSRQSGADEEEQEEPRGASSSGPQEETLLQEGEGLTVRSLYRFSIFKLEFLFVCFDSANFVLFVSLFVFLLGEAIFLINLFYEKVS